MVEAQLVPLQELFLENCRFEPLQKSFSTEEGASICQGSWEVWLAQTQVC